MRRLLDRYGFGGVEELDSPMDLIIHTKAPEKWKLVDLETGEEYLGSEIGTNFAEILRSKVSTGKIGTWVKTKWKQKPAVD